MGKTQKNSSTPALNKDSQTAKNIALAEKAAGEHLEAGTASSQLITHYLKLATQREAIELEKLRREVILLEAKTEDVKSGPRIEELYNGVIAAIQSYGPSAPLDYDT